MHTVILGAGGLGSVIGGFLAKGGHEVTLIGRPAHVEAVRKTMGATNPAKSEPGTIRGDLGLEMGRNLIHGSDSLDSARREIALFFTDDQLHSYERDVDRWIFEA